MTLSNDETSARARLLRILPVDEEARAQPMVEAGLHSAIQIAELPRAQFLTMWATLFPAAPALGATVYANAVARRTQVLLAYVKAVQEDEPHYKAARFD